MIDCDLLIIDKNSINFLNEEATRVQKVCKKIKSANVASSTSAIVRVAEAIIDSYSRNKSIRGMLDYDDLIVKTREKRTFTITTSIFLFKKAPTHLS